MYTNVVFLTLTIFTVVYGQEAVNQLTAAQPVVGQPLQQSMPGQDVRSNNNKPQIIVIENKEPHHKPHHDNVQTFVLQKPLPQKEIIIAKPIHSNNHHKETIEVIKVPAHNQEHQHNHNHPPHVSHHRKCEILSRKGECTSIPHFFSCIRDGGVLAPDIGECSFTQACCIRNFFGQ